MSVVAAVTLVAFAAPVAAAIQPADIGASDDGVSDDLVASETPVAAAPILYLPYAAGASYKVTQGNHGSYSHNGTYGKFAVDFSMADNTPILSSAPGTVKVAKTNCPNYRQDSCNGGLGNYVVVEHSAGFCTQYAHLRSVKRTSGTVKSGEEIGRSGNSGWSTGPHLDFRRTSCNTVSTGFKFVEYTGSYEHPQIVNKVLKSQNTGSFTTAPTPTISGTARVNATLTANPGSWTPVANIAYQWRRDGAAISGATSKTYKPVAADLGKKMSVSVTGSLTGYSSVTKTSALTGTVAPDTFTSTPSPTIAGVAKFESTLALSTAAWSPVATFTYQWLRDGAAVPGATSTTYVLSLDDIGKRMSVAATGSRNGYASVTRVSEPTDIVVPGTFDSAPPPTITGAAKFGSTLTVVTGEWSPVATFTYQWLRGGVAVPGATSTTYALGLEDIGKRVSVAVTGSRVGYVTVRNSSEATDVVTPAAFNPPPKPSISGKAKVGAILTADPGEWSPAARFKYQWNRDGKAIPGATAKTYKLKPADKGKKITVSVTGSKAGYKSVTKKSKATNAVSE